MELQKLLENVKVKEIIGESHIDVKNIAIDSNLVTDGSVFVCLEGCDFDGHDYVKQAKMYGALAIIAQKRVQTDLCQVIVEDCRSALCVICANFHNNIHKKMNFIGVVGTNGKTTTAHMINFILNYSGIRSGAIGTLGAFYDNTTVEHSLTTPDPIEFFNILSDMYVRGVTNVVMEVSAHAIYYKKVYGIDFKVGVFTNLSQDHLDFFKQLEDYKKIKKSFFESKVCKYVVANGDDKLGREIINQIDGTISYGIDNPSDVFAIDVKRGKSGLAFTLNLFDCVYKIKLKFYGKFNVYNALAASTACALCGVNTKLIAEGLCKLVGISGRLEQVYNGKFKIFVDYAHTPDGLLNSLVALGDIVDANLICVFGCGGNRDKTKRELMGYTSGKKADYTIITSDNPRFEDPMDIIRSIEDGMLKSGGNYVIVQDRIEAIEYAINMAREGDIILIAGKGGEKYQEVLGVKKEYNDKDAVEEILRSKSY